MSEIKYRYFRFEQKEKNVDKKYRLSDESGLEVYGKKGWEPSSWDLESLQKIFGDWMKEVDGPL